MLNKQSRIDDKGWSFNLVVWRRTKTPHREKTACYELLNRASGKTLSKK